MPVIESLTGFVFTLMCLISCNLLKQKPDNTTNIKIGTLIALVVEPGSDWQNVSIPVEEGPPTQAPVPSAAGTATPSSTGPSAVGRQHRLVLVAQHKYLFLKTCRGNFAFVFHCNLHKCEV